MIDFHRGWVLPCCAQPASNRNGYCNSISIAYQWTSMDSLMLSPGGGGGTCSIHGGGWGGVWHIFAIENLHPWYFVDQETCHNFFGLKVCLTVKILPCIFLSVKFRVHVLFWVCNMKLHRPSPPPSSILRVFLPVQFLTEYYDIFFKNFVRVEFLSRQKQCGT